MTLVGVVRPKLLVTRPLIDALTADELRAAIEHEVGHLGAWDNLKRLAMRATPDGLSLLPASRGIERQWAAAAELAADAASRARFRHAPRPRFGAGQGGASDAAEPLVRSARPARSSAAKGSPRASSG